MCMERNLSLQLANCNVLFCTGSIQEVDFQKIRKKIMLFLQHNTSQHVIHVLVYDCTINAEYTQVTKAEYVIKAERKYIYVCLRACVHVCALSNDELNMYTDH